MIHFNSTINRFTKAAKALLLAGICFQAMSAQSYATESCNPSPEVDKPVTQSPDLTPADRLPDAPNGPLYECLANNPNCVVFYAINSSARVAQDQAMARCFQFPPGVCRPIGCHRLP